MVQRFRKGRPHAHVGAGLAVVGGCLLSTGAPRHAPAALVFCEEEEISTLVHDCGRFRSPVLVMRFKNRPLRLLSHANARP